MPLTGPSKCLKNWASANVEIWLVKVGPCLEYLLQVQQGITQTLQNLLVPLTLSVYSQSYLPRT